MSGYILAAPAQEDLLAIRRYYLREAGYRIARQKSGELVAAFRMIARNPVSDIGTRIWQRTVPMIRRSVEIVMIMHGSRDIAALILHRDL
jgi:plasmid stabilization system protein ParE